jgi:hypothetical protein
MIFRTARFQRAHGHEARRMRAVRMSMSMLMAVIGSIAAMPAHAINIAVEHVEVPKPLPPIPFVKPKPPPPAPVPRIRLTGMIETGDAGKLEAELARIAAAAGRRDGPLTTIELSSMGGSLTEGFEIGALLRKFRVIAVVRKGDLCLSSCALAFLGGNVHHMPSVYPNDCNVEIGAKVAFHNFFLNRNGLRDATSADPVASRLQGFADARGGAALLVKYAGDMGLPPNFVANLMGRPVEDFQYIETVGQFLSFHVCPIGLKGPSTPPETQARNVCVNAMGGGETPAATEVRAIAADEAKLYLLQRLQANMQSSRARGRLAADLTSGAVMRSRAEIDRMYDDLRAAGVALPEIVGPTFEVNGLAPGTSCYASLSASNADDFDVTVFGPRGFNDPPREPPENSRRLFLYDKKDVVNPKPR